MKAIMIYRLIKRLTEFSLGVMLILASLGRYNNKPMVMYAMHSGVMAMMIVIAALILASRLIAGKPKDYSAVSRWLTKINRKIYAPRRL